jgi:hypothetical protein
MKEENVKIIQMMVEPYVYYTSNGSAYKDTHKSHKIFGLGDDNKIYRWGKHTNYSKGFGYSEKYTGWRLYVPED